MEVSSIREVNELKSPRSGTRVKTNGFAVLIPFLTEGYQQVEMNPAALFVKVVNMIKARTGTAEYGGIGDNGEGYQQRRRAPGRSRGHCHDASGGGTVERNVEVV